MTCCRGKLVWNDSYVACFLVPTVLCRMNWVSDKGKGSYFMFWNRCFVGVCLNAFFWMCVNHLLLRISQSLPFKNSTYFTCLSVCLDLSLHYVDCICLAYQKSTLWKTKSEDGGQINSICFALNCPIFKMKVVILTPFLWSVLERKVF